MIQPHLFPNLIGIGPRRCATTWLGRMLEQDRRFSLAYVTKKEPHLFSSILPRHGMSGLQDAYSSDDRKSYRCDFTPTYIGFTKSEIKAIKRLSPEAKIIIFKRDPVQRVISCLMRERKFEKDGANFKRGRLEEFLYLNSGLCRRENEKMISPHDWERIWESQAIFHVDFYDVKTTPNTLLTDFSKFMDIDKLDVPKKSKKPTNISSDFTVTVHEANRIALLTLWLKRTNKAALKEQPHIKLWSEEWQKQLATFPNLSLRKKVQNNLIVNITEIHYAIYTFARYIKGILRARKLNEIAKNIGA